MKDQIGMREQLQNRGIREKTHFCQSTITMLIGFSNRLKRCEVLVKYFKI